ncbi:MAG: PAS domain S-box-containing protein, partial [Gammaproteobacteria bacterium]
MAERDDSDVMALREELAQVRNELSDREEDLSRYRDASTFARLALWEANIDTGEVWWNETLNCVFGERPLSTQHAWDWWVERIHPDDRARVPQSLREAIESGAGVWSENYRYRHADGHYRNVRDQARIWSDARGKRAHGVMQDISDHVRLLEAMEQSRDTYASLTNALPAVLTYIDTEQRFVFANRMFYEWHGRTPEGTIGRKISEVLVSTVYSVLQPYIAAALRGKRVTFEMAVPSAHAGPRQVIATYVPDQRDDGTVRGIQVLVTDVTARHQAEKRLRDQHELLHVTLDSIADGVLATDVDGRVTFANSVAGELLDCSVDMLRGCLLSDAVDLVDEQTLKPVVQTVVSSAHSEAESRSSSPGLLRSRNGVLIPTLYSAAPIRDSSGDILGTVLVLSDIRITRDLERAVQQGQQMQALGTLAGGIAHEFNNVLTAIMGHTELAQRALPTNSPADLHLVDLVRAAHRARDVVRQILSFSRQADTQRVPLLIAQIVAEALELVRPSLPVNVRVHTDIDNDSGLAVADRSHIHQIVLNLCANAQAAMRPGGGDLSVTVSQVSLSVEMANLQPDLIAGRYVMLQVADTGSGIEPFDLPRIFEPFFTTKPTGEGTGMGLSIVHGIVKIHDGDIVVESTHQGSTFTVYFPVAEPAEPAEPTVAQDAEHVGGTER